MFRTGAARALVILFLVLPGFAAGQDTGDVARDRGLQWGFDRIGAVDAWDTGRGSGVTIAVIDSGVSLGHHDLAPNVVDGIACNDTGGAPEACTGSAEDEHGHGTHVAGIAAAVAGNRIGIAGVAPEARIMPVKVLHSACPTCPASGNAADVVAAIRWAASRGADIINLSLGSTTDTVFGPGFREAIRDAWDEGAIPVVAAGNQYVLTADFGDAPAIVVSATRRDDTAPSYSNGVGRARWAIAAPGGEGGDTAASCAEDGEPLGILSTYSAADSDGGYACLSGTSMAAPHVSGGLAVLLSAGLDPPTAVATILETAEDVGEPGPDALFGAGLVDLRAAAAAIPTLAPTAAPDDVGVPADVTTPSPSGDGEEGDAETSAPQPFVVDGDLDPVPLPLTLVAVAGIVGTAGALAQLRRRGLV